MDKREMQEQLRDLFVELEEHSKLVNKTVDSVRLSLQNDASVGAVDDLRKLLSNMTAARKVVEKSKSLIKARVLERIKG